MHRPDRRNLGRCTRGGLLGILRMHALFPGIAPTIV
jgi:hypothetical protein